jgi:hypothetical protein
MVQLTLSTAYLSSLHPSSIPNNFDFVDQRGQSYPCNIVLAQLLSPRVAQLLSTDPTSASLEIEVKDENALCLFTSLVRCGTATVHRKRLTSCISLAGQLGNTELAKQLRSFHPIPSNLSPSNILHELRFYEKLGELPPVELIRFASANFYRLTEVLGHQLKPETLDLICSESSLVLETEDQLFEFLKGEICAQSIDLLGHVELCCLSDGKYDELMDLLDPSTLTPVIWSRIRSIRPDRSHRSESHKYIHAPPLKVPYESKAFDGIFAHLNRLAGGNCVEKGIIGAKDSDKYGRKLSVLFADSDWSGGNYWYHNNFLNGWFTVDFKDRRVSVTHYAIHNSLSYVREHHFLKTWTLEGSNLDSDSDSDWTKIDSRSNDETLHGASKLQGVFSCNGDTSHAFRYIRLVQRGASHDARYYHFAISQLELFGTLSPAK